MINTYEAMKKQKSFVDVIILKLSAERETMGGGGEANEAEVERDVSASCIFRGARNNI